ncbi:MAG: sugar kinase [Armatimonadetes bacterium]|nr:sugar kinase [Armatimonadota bacterium]
MATVVTFGEIMLRLTPPGFQRFIQARSLDATFGGGEANVAVSLANYGVDARFVTALPPHEIGDACENYLRQFGVDTSHIVRSGERLGIYFLEMGAVQRGSKVIYDRANSALATLQPGEVDWEAAFSGADWFHWTGITPAISANAAAVLEEGVQKAAEMGLTISCDLNYRSKLWKWGKEPGEVMAGLVELADYAIGNEEDAEKVFGITAEGVDVEAGAVEAAAYQSVCEQLMERFGKLKKVAITLRGSISASHNQWSGVLYDGSRLYEAKQYDITHIVDRVGGGDSFCGGLIYALLSGKSDQEAIDFAVAASCLKHTIYGDFNMVTVDEVEKLASGPGTGRVQR